jgi:uncharacterized membrane protein YhhN
MPLADMAKWLRKRGGIYMARTAEVLGLAQKAVLALGVVVGLSYVFAENADLYGAQLIAWKGGAVWLFAMYAAMRAQNTDGWLITAVMGLGSLGDVLVEQDQTLGGAAFVVGHSLATVLYLRNLRSRRTVSQKALAIFLVPTLLFLCWFLTEDGLAMFYTLFLGMMAASAWISRFPRYRTGIGAMMFVASDMLIFASDGVLAEANWVDPLIWLLYLGGQFLIVVGVTRKLAEPRSKRTKSR